MMESHLVVCVCHFLFPGLPDYKPYVTLAISFTQMIVFILLCYFGGLAPIGLRPKTVYLDDVKTFRGTETVVSTRYPNVWIGPSTAFWARKFEMVYILELGHVTFQY